MPLEDRTEQATPRRREDARKKGQVAKSMEATSAAVLLISLVVLKYSGPRIGAALQAIVEKCLTQFPRGDLRPETVHSTMISLFMQLGWALAPLFGAVFVAALVVNVAQVGLMITTQPLVPNLGKLNPLGGIARMFSPQSAVELIKAIAKVALVGYVVYSSLRAETSSVMALVGSDFRNICTGIGMLAWKLLVKATSVILVIAVFDYAYQRIRHENSLKMTKQEVKEDFKRSEGDPMIKSRIKQRQREIGRQRMMQDVLKADVVITNPTHFAVALKYDPDVSPAPKVLAKGQNLVALKIKELAYENHIPVVENKPLARTLHKMVEIGDEIPAELYQAVAEVLAYVYRLNEKLKAG